MPVEYVVGAQWKLNGGLHRYFAVPLLVHRQLLRSGSPGSYVDRRIKPFYSCKEVT
jgi:hypothetical protein